jgi:valyl-tRNA synthetase
MDAKLDNPQFMAKAKEEAVVETRERKDELEGAIKRLKAAVKRLEAAG